MSPEEFERLKEQEKAHLRKIRQIKQQGADAKRKLGLSAALGKLADQLGSLGETDRLTRDMQEGQARIEARFEMAADAAADRAEREEAERVLREAEADGLLAQMRAEMLGNASPAAGTRDAPDAARTEKPAPTGGKSIGRARPEPEPEEPAAERSAKTIGRRRG
jgi:hypothetical protein